MNADFLQSLIGANLPTLAALACNGEFRLISLRDAVQTDARGFPNSDYIPDAQSFTPCSYTARRADEKESGSVVRSLDFFEITTAQIVGGNQIVIENGKKIQLRLKKDALDYQTLDVVSVTNQNGAAWVLWAIESK